MIDILIFPMERVYLKTETLSSIFPVGHAGDLSKALCKVMELPNLMNANNISCIPEGKHIVDKELFTQKHPYPHFRIPNVAGRNGILLHRITFVKDLRGCLGIGGAFQDLNKDGVPDVVQSKIALQALYDMMPDKFILHIYEQPAAKTARLKALAA